MTDRRLSGFRNYRVSFRYDEPILLALWNSIAKNFDASDFFAEFRVCDSSDISRRLKIVRYDWRRYLLKIDMFVCNNDIAYYCDIDFGNKTSKTINKYLPLADPNCFYRVFEMVLMSFETYETGPDHI